MSEEVAQTQSDKPLTSSQDIASRASAPANDFKVPEGYQEKGWAKDLKSQDDVWKLLDNSQSLIGKRPAGIPAADAPPEEWDKFYNTLGRPEAADKYEFGEVEGLPEGVDLSAHTGKFAEFAHKYGLTQKQAEGLRNDWLAYEMSQAEANQGVYTEKAKELVEKHFKDTSVLNKTDDALSQYVPEDLHEPLAQAMQSNPVLQAGFAKLYEGMQAEISKIKKDYGGEDNLKSGGQSSSVSLDEVRSELAKLRVSNAARNPLDPEHKKTIERINELSGTVQRMVK